MDSKENICKCSKNNKIVFKNNSDDTKDKCSDTLINYSNKSKKIDKFNCYYDYFIFFSINS